jgi:hypothetical protein
MSMKRTQLRQFLSETFMLLSDFKSTPSHCISLRYGLILSSLLSPSGLFPSGFRLKFCTHFTWRILASTHKRPTVKGIPKAAQSENL